MNTRPRRPRIDSTVTTLVLTLIVSALLTAATGVSAFSELNQLGPTIGSIVVFRPNDADATWWHIDAAVGDLDGTVLRRCVLRPSVMQTGGGSIVIEARRMSSPPVYRVHWAGARTSRGATDCGASADIVLSRAELMRLADVAGGFDTKFRLTGQ